MEQLFSRYRNLSLMAVLICGQLILLAYQVRRPGGVRLLRRWSIAAIVPFEKGSQFVVAHSTGLLRNYVALRDAHLDNVELRRRLAELELENAALRERASEAVGLAQLLHFQQTYIGRTVAAQVIGGGASTDSQVLYINRGSRDGIAPDMPVITPAGVVGKTSQVFAGTAQVLLITDAESGVGAMLQDSRVHGVLQGQGPGQVQLAYVTRDEQVRPGEVVVTSGDDQIYPAGLPLGVVESSTPGRDLWRIITVRPTVSLSSIESVLVVTKTTTRVPTHLVGDASADVTAAELRLKQLPSVPANDPLPRTGDPPTAQDAFTLLRMAAHPSATGTVSPSARLAAAPSSPASAAAAASKTAHSGRLSAPPAAHGKSGSNAVLRPASEAVLNAPSPKPTKANASGTADATGKVRSGASAQPTTQRHDAANAKPVASPATPHSASPAQSGASVEPPPGTVH
jgi:rod shape-determining protein MreC